eukprot:GHUV01031203.1.p1 GENE.GHUV01031203.1~~GHUV01031203.1.p1  ORF type:complete len:112 (+),score=31.75 GHUV01031203.1:305-640(+)
MDQPVVYGEWMQRRVDAGAACISLKQYPYFYHVGMQCASLMSDLSLAAFLRKTFSQRCKDLLSGSLKAPDGAALQRVLGKLNEEEKACEFCDFIFVLLNCKHVSLCWRRAC